MHADAAYWAILGDEAAPDFPALAALLVAWQGTGARAPRDLFEQPPARLAELLGCDEEALAPLLARRPRLAQARRLVERLPAGVDMLARGERRYPRALTGALGQDAPRVLWYLGSLSVLTDSAVALFGTRDSQQESLATARAMAGQVAVEGRVLVTGIARPLERAALDAALAMGGAAVVVLGMGIAVAQPEVRRLLPYVVAERLMLLSPLGPRTPWQPGLEGRRVEVAMALAVRAILIAPGEAGDALEAARSAQRLARPLVVWPASAAALAPGAVSWTSAPDGGEGTSTTEAQRHRGITERNESGQEAPKEVGGRPDGDHDAAHGDTRSSRKDVAAAPPNAAAAGADGQHPEGAQRVPDPPIRSADHTRERVPGRRPSNHTSTGGEPEARSPRPEAPAAAVGEDLAEAVLRYLTRTRRKVTSKGRLLQALGVTEADLDHVLLALIAAGRVAQMRHRSGAAYAAVQDDEPRPAAATFQLSLFGQDIPTSDAPPASAPGAPRNDSSCTA